LTQALTPLAVSHHDVLAFLADHPGADAKAIADATERVPSNIRRDMPRLVKDGLVDDRGAITGRARAALDVMDGSKTEPRPGAVIGLKHAEIRIAPTLNPRREFLPEVVEDLALSIAEYGLLQNLVVREVKGANGVRPPSTRYVLVAGEHRLAAIALLIRRGKWQDDQAIPCKVIEADDARHTEVALIENLRRKALAPMEEARAFQKLRDVYQVPTIEIARRIGLTQRVVQQRLQLLGLDDEQQLAVSEKRLNVEAARKLVATPKPAPAPRSDDPAPAPWLQAQRAAEHVPFDAPIIVHRPYVAIGPASLRYDGAIELLRAVALHPRQSPGAYWSACGVPLNDSAIRRRLKGFFEDGLVDKANGPTLTDKGIAALRAIEGLPSLEKVALAEAVDEAAIALEQRLSPETLGRLKDVVAAGEAFSAPAVLMLVEARLEAANHALESGTILSASRRALHAELWEPAPTVAFLELVLKALQP
jgi:ParB/RepB/Spo0J family partition protein